MRSANKMLWWVLGTDEKHHWHQRIIQAADDQAVVEWWNNSLGRNPDIVLDHDGLEQAMEVLNLLSDDLQIQSSGEHLFAAWVGSSQELGVIPIIAASPTAAHKKAQQEHEVLAVVDARPLLDTLARMRAIEAGEDTPDERVR